MGPLRQIVSKNKVVDSKLLNLLGVQVQRTLAARLIYNLRRVSVDKAVKDQVDELRSEGMVLLPDFLPPDHFEGVRREYLPLLDENVDKLTVYRHGGTRRQTPGKEYLIYLPFEDGQLEKRMGPRC